MFANIFAKDLNIEITKQVGPAPKLTSEQVRKKVDPLNTKVAGLSVVNDDLQKHCDLTLGKIASLVIVLSNGQSNLITTSAEINGLEKSLEKMNKDYEKAEKAGDEKKKNAIKAKMVQPAKNLKQKLTYASNLIKDIEADSKKAETEMNGFFGKMKTLAGKV